MRAVGIFLALAGLALALVPVAALHAASSLRFTGLPPRPTPLQVRTWRIAGAVIVVVGIAVAVAVAVAVAAK